MAQQPIVVPTSVADPTAAAPTMPDAVPTIVTIAVDVAVVVPIVAYVSNVTCSAVSAHARRCPWDVDWADWSRVANEFDNEREV